MPKTKFLNSFQEVVNGSYKFHFLVIFLLAMLLLFANLHIGGLSGYDDALYAAEGREMFAGGDWWNVHFNGYLNFEYPPLFIWLEAASFAVLGISDFAAKFPSALLGLLTIAALFWLAKELSENFWFPVISAWILMLSPYFMKYAMHSMTDVPFVFFFTLAVFFYVKGLKRTEYLIFCGIAVAGAILTRSVIGLIPAALIFAHLIFTRQFRLFRSPLAWAGILLALLIPAAWYFPQYQAHGQEFITRHLAFIGSKVASDKPFALPKFLAGLSEYPSLLFKLYEPWFWLMLFGLAIHLKKAFRLKDGASILFCLWAASIVVPFSLADQKVLRYILAAFPAFAMLAAAPLSGWLEIVERRTVIAVVYAVLCVIVLLIVIFPNPKLRAEEVQKIAPAVRANVPPPQRVVYYTGEDVKHDIINQLLWYSGRFIEIISDEAKWKEKLRSGDDSIFVTGRPEFQNLASDPRLKFQIIEETDNLVCFKNGLP